MYDCERVYKRQWELRGRGTPGCPITFPLWDELVHKSHILSSSCSQGQRTIENFSLNLSVCQLIYSAAPQAPLNSSGTPLPFVSQSPFVKFFSFFLQTFLNVPPVQSFGSGLIFPEPPAAAMPISTTWTVGNSDGSQSCV